MSDSNGTTVNGHGQNRRQLPVLPPTPRPRPRKAVNVEDLKDLTDKELIALANGHHREFCGTLRKAVVEHAGIAGHALLQLKSRQKHGTWEDWLKKNFQGSAKSAQLYMRIAKHWRLIVQHGLDREGMTLEDLQWVLSDSPGPRPGSATKEKQKKAKEELKLDADGAKADESAAPNRQVPLYFSESDKEEFEEWVKRLGAAYKTDNLTDTVREAVRREYEAVTGEGVANG
jgi:hypothetical protein